MAPSTFCWFTRTIRSIRYLRKKALLRTLPAGVKASDLITVARFWRARDKLTWEALPESDSLQWTLKRNVNEPVEGLTLSADVAGVRVEAHRLILHAMERGQEVVLHVRNAR
jgi:hypothetical protein